MEEGEALLPTPELTDPGEYSNACGVGLQVISLGYAPLWPIQLRAIGRIYLYLWERDMLKWQLKMMQALFLVGKHTEHNNYIAKEENKGKAEQGRQNM